MKKEYVVLAALACLCCADSAKAKPRSIRQITAIASRTLQPSRLGLARLAAKTTSISTLASADAYTVMGFKDGGYAIVSNDDLLPQVLAYSASRFDKDSANDGFRWWLNAINASAKAVVESGKSFHATKPSTLGYAAEVPQLMASEWGQMEPFNNLCPLEYNQAGQLVGRTVVGCVATAMSQVMYYHHYPTQGTGTYTDMQTTDANGNPLPLTVDLSQYTYDYSKMRDTYTPGNYTDEQALEAAQLCYTTGVTFAMIYGTGASGTYSDSAAVSLKEHFGFPNAQLLERKDYDESTWMNIIFDELSHSRPLMYSGADNIYTIGGGGHAFVFDGYDADGLVHVNWGWYGRNDGYYDVALLNPRIHSFTENQDMIIGCAPENAYASQSLTVTGPLSVDSLSALSAMATTGSLRKLDLSDATLTDDALPENAFADSKLVSIVLPKTLKTIGDGAFANCRELTSVAFPDRTEGQNFVVVGDIVYNPDTTEVIEVMPYYHNNDLVMTDYNSLLTLAPSTRKLHQHALDGCFRIHGVELPASVTYIGSGAFNNTPDLKRLYAKGTTPAATEPDAFATLDPGYTILAIPAGTSEVYKRSGAWKNFFKSDNVKEVGTNIKALNASRVYGEANPKLRYQISGDYVSGTPVLRCDADEKSPVGDYPIIVEMGSVEGDTVALTNGVLRIKPATLTVKAEDATREQGQDNPVFSISYSGFKNEEDENVLTVKPVATTTATKESPVGVYDIVVDGGEATNYKLEYINGKLTVTESTGIGTVGSDKQVPVDVYSVDGRLVGKGLTSLKGLCRGVYIVGEKKILVR